MATRLSFTVTLALLFILITATKSVPASELDSMLASLRSQRGYTLIANAITTSDLKLTLLNTSSFTLFAPTDSSVFALDVSAETTAFSYVSVLRSHFIPDLRLSATNIRRLPMSSPSSFTSMLPSRNVRVVRESSSSELVSVDSVDLVLPGLFYSRHIAVHGLAGILPGSSPPLSPPPRVRHRGRRSRNRRGRNLPKVSQVNNTVVISPPENVTNLSNLTVLPPPVPDNGSSLSPIAVNNSAFAPSPSPRNDGLVKKSSGSIMSPRSFEEPPSAMVQAPMGASLPPTRTNTVRAPASVSLPPMGSEIMGTPVSISLPPTRTEMMGAPEVSKVAMVKWRNLAEKCDLDRMAGQCYASLDL